MTLRTWPDGNKQRKVVGHAVRDAAPEATGRMAQHLAHDPVANQEAMQFLRSEGMRIAELIARGRASMNAEATRVFLLIDAAAG